MEMEIKSESVVTEREQISSRTFQPELRVWSGNTKSAQPRRGQTRDKKTVQGDRLSPGPFSREVS